MLFNSPAFIFFFLPLILFFSLKLKGQWLLGWICLSSCLFYAWAGHLWFLAPMIATTLSDFYLARKMAGTKDQKIKKIYLALAIGITLAFLGYFKYAGFFLRTFTGLTDPFFHFEISARFRNLFNTVLPAGISFYSFQAISYILDVYNEKCEAEKNFLRFSAFIVFFPHLIAGPLTRHNQLIPQLEKIAQEGVKPRWREGLFLFVLGLAKKVLIADVIGPHVDHLLVNYSGLTVVTAWLAMIGYGLQLYFDFSGYSDMAIGLGRLFGVEFPQNFNRPYLANSPADFWRRWHITLSNWLRDYIYVYIAFTGPARETKIRAHINIILTMLIGGLWHGANWTYILWGGYQGVLIAGFQATRGKWNKMGKAVQILLTYLLTTLGWALFRAPNLKAAGLWLGAAIGFSGGSFASNFVGFPTLMAVLCALGLLIIFLVPNASNYGKYNSLGPAMEVVLAMIAVMSFALMERSSQFLYFQF